MFKKRQQQLFLTRQTLFQAKATSTTNEPIQFNMSLDQRSHGSQTYLDNLPNLILE